MQFDNSPNHLGREPTPAEMAQLSSWLLTKAKGTIHSMAMLEGFVTAAALSPELLPMSDFLKAVQGEAVPDSLEEVNQTLNLLMIYMNYITGLARNAKGDEMLLEPCFLSEADQARMVSMAEEWSQGFMQAVKLQIEDWEQYMFEEDDEEEEIPLLFPILLLSVKLPNVANTPEEQVLSLGEQAARNIRPCLELVRESILYGDPLEDEDDDDILDAAPGRNDPCPCGSGKKYKKCCMLHEE